jgi:hypothetical protein
VRVCARVFVRDGVRASVLRGCVCACECMCACVCPRARVRV